MAESLNQIRLLVELTAFLRNTVDGTQIAEVPAGRRFSPATILTTGTTANKADQPWQDAGRTLTSGNSEDIDLYDFGTIDIGMGAGKGMLGQSLTLAELVAILVINQTGSAGNLLVGNNGTAAAFNSIFNSSDTANIPIAPGGLLLLFNPADPAYVITDVTNHLLRFTASGGNVTYDLYLLGRSA